MIRKVRHKNKDYLDGLKFFFLAEKALFVTKSFTNFINKWTAFFSTNKFEESLKTRVRACCFSC